MKFPQDSSDVKSTSKLLKPQVERRRRERMNRSLDKLKSLLLQQHQQEHIQRRVEKAEILERTVLFLQNTAREDEARAARPGLRFQDGFSACMQRAALFLGPGAKALWLQGALDASFTARFARSESAGEQPNTDAFAGSLLLRKSTRAILQMLIHRSGYTLRSPALNVATCVRTSDEPRRSRPASQQTHRVTSRDSKRSLPPMGLPVGQSLWRPWP